jgi:hypothetical protein
MRHGLFGGSVAAVLLSGLAVIHCGSTDFSVSGDGGTDAAKQPDATKGGNDAVAESGAKDAGTDGALPVVSCINAADCKSDGAGYICCANPNTLPTGACVQATSCPDPVESVELCETIAGTKAPCPVGSGKCEAVKCLTVTFFACSNDVPPSCTVIADAGTTLDSGIGPTPDAGNDSGVTTGLDASKVDAGKVPDSGGSSGGKTNGSACSTDSECASDACCPTHMNGDGPNGTWTDVCASGCTAEGTCTLGATCGNALGTCSYYECQDVAMSPSKYALVQACDVVSATMIASGGSATGTWTCSESMGTIAP